MANRLGGENARKTLYKPFLGTFHSLGARILRKECRFLGRSPNFTIFDDHDSFDVLKKAIKQVGDGTANSESGKKKENPAGFMANISNMKNVGRFFMKEDSRNGSSSRIEAIYERYEAGLEENNAFDFDDLIEKVVRLWKARPEVLRKYQSMFDAVLVDEYQDINPLQHEFVKLLAGVHKNLSVVGDDEQTIYGWRYADIGIFLGFEKEWPGATVYFLEENYRSTGAIIRAASTVVRNNKVRAPKKLWTKNDDGESITLYEAWTESEEAEWIAGEIQKLKIKNQNEGVAVLYRTNAQSRAIEQALIRREIPYRIFGGLKFYERREIKDIVAGLRFVANEKDSLSRERLEKNLTKRKFAVFREKMAEMQVTKPADVITTFLESFHYMEYLEDNFLNTEERQENVAELVSFASSFTSLDELLERLSLLQSTDDENRSGELRTERGKEVTLMTVHMSKGLEFDSVFIAGAAEGLLPHARSMDSEISVEEERRLMYVAMTRARKRLFISFSGMPSRFIGEIPDDCIILQTAENDGRAARGGESDEEYVVYE